jgi:CubicO group peptidase (beta-lactamase class C family)
MRHKTTVLLLVGVLAAVVPLRPSRADDSDTVAKRIAAVENGLLPGTLVAGEPVPFMKLADRMAHYNIPGVSVAVINNGAVEWAKGYGVRRAGGEAAVTASTMFQAASISKAVSAVAVLTLVGKGVIELDRDVNSYLTTWKLPDNEFTKADKVTIRRILSHTAGLTVWGFAGYERGDRLPTLVEMLDGRPPSNSDPIRVFMPPGRRWLYSGGGFLVMQRTVEDITDKPFTDFIAARILRPAGMSNSGYHASLPDRLWGQAAAAHDGDGEPVPGGWHDYPEIAAASLWTTAGDLALFAIAVQQSLQGAPGSVLATDTAAETMTGQEAETGRLSWGLGFELGGEGRAAWFGHGGSNLGYDCRMVAFTETGQGAVVMTNGDDGDWLVDEILQGIARQYDWPEFNPKTKSIASVEPSVVEALAGDYRIDSMGGIPFSVDVRGGVAYLVVPVFRSDLQLYPASETTFFAREATMDIVVVRDREGAVTALDFRGQGLMNFTAPKIR